MMKINISAFLFLLAVVLLGCFSYNKPATNEEYSKALSMDNKLSFDSKNEYLLICDKSLKRLSSSTITFKIKHIPNAFICKKDTLFVFATNLSHIGVDESEYNSYTLYRGVLDSVNLIQRPAFANDDDVQLSIGITPNSKPDSIYIIPSKGDYIAWNNTITSIVLNKGSLSGYFLTLE